MACSCVLSFVKDISVDETGEGQIIIETPFRRSTLKRLTPGLRTVIQTLATRGATEDELADRVVELDGESLLPKFYFFLQTFMNRQMINFSIPLDGLPLAILTPVSQYFTFSPNKVSPQKEYILSRFAYFRRENGHMVLECPLSHAKIELKGWMAAALISELESPKTCDGLYNALPDIPEDAVELLLSLLLGANFIAEFRRNEPYPGESEVLAQWDFHDLLFHSRSREGRHNNRSGGTYRFHDKIDPLPAVKPQMSTDVISLYRPDLNKLEQDDYPFTLILEQRQSIREYARQPITDKQLGEFLYRTARVKEVLKTDIQDVSRRPYPGGGAIYELELYLTVNQCRDIPCGLYHYDPQNHQLCKISALNDKTKHLLKDAAGSSGIEKPLQVLVTVTSRFQRLSWKYEAMAYNVILKNVGVLYQTMYLVATAMDLSPCALGGGDSDLFAATAGLNYYEETSVGEFLLGSKRM